MVWRFCGNAHHCVKRFQIRSYFWSVFSPNTEKYGPEITLYLDTFPTVSSEFRAIHCRFYKNSNQEIRCSFNILRSGFHCNLSRLAAQVLVQVTVKCGSMNKNNKRVFENIWEFLSIFPESQLFS